MVQRIARKQRRHFLKGNSAFFKSKDQIIKLSSRDVSAFRAVYRFLSSNLHSVPMGFYRMADGDRGRGVESRVEIKYTRMCLELAIDYLDTANVEYRNLYE